MNKFTIKITNMSDTTLSVIKSAENHGECSFIGPSQVHSYSSAVWAFKNVWSKMFSGFISFEGVADGDAFRVGWDLPLMFGDPEYSSTSPAGWTIDIKQGGVAGDYRVEFVFSKAAQAGSQSSSSSSSSSSSGSTTPGKEAAHEESHFVPSGAPLHAAVDTDPGKISTLCTGQGCYWVEWWNQDNADKDEKRSEDKDRAALIAIWGLSGYGPADADKGFTDAEKAKLDAEMESRGVSPAMFKWRLSPAHAEAIAKFRNDTSKIPTCSKLSLAFRNAYIPEPAVYLARDAKKKAYEKAQADLKVAEKHLADATKARAKAEADFDAASAAAPGKVAAAGTNQAAVMRIQKHVTDLDVALQKQKALADAAKAARDKLQNPDDNSNGIVKDAKKALDDANAAVKEAEDQGKIAAWQFGGDHGLITKDYQDGCLDATKQALADADAKLRKKLGTVSDAKDQQLTKQLNTALDLTDKVYKALGSFLFTEGGTNAINCWDTTFTYGAGWNITGGVNVFRYLFRPTRGTAVWAQEEIDALAEIITYMHKAGVHMVDRDTLAPQLQIAHVEQKKDGTFIGWVIDSNTAPKLNGVQEKNPQDAGWAYVRHHRRVIEAFITWGRVDELPGQTKKINLPIKNVGFKIQWVAAYELHTQGIKLFRLAKTQALITLLVHMHHFGQAYRADDLILAAIARGKVKAVIHYKDADGNPQTTVSGLSIKPPQAPKKGRDIIPRDIDYTGAVDLSSIGQVELAAPPSEETDLAIAYYAAGAIRELQGGGAAASVSDFWQEFARNWNQEPGVAAKKLKLDASDRVGFLSPIKPLLDIYTSKDPPLSDADALKEVKKEWLVYEQSDGSLRVGLRKVDFEDYGAIYRLGHGLADPVELPEHFSSSGAPQ